MSGERITREAIERRLMLPGGVAWVVEVVVALEAYVTPAPDCTDCDAERERHDHLDARCRPHEDVANAAYERATAVLSRVRR
jgi:hypothetical protein